jgi:hypothetical protein
MKTSFKDEIHATRHVVLSEAEKEHTRKILHALMQEHPATEPRGGLSWFVMQSITIKIGAGVVAALILYSGVALGAGSSLPGSALYPFKIYVTEPLRAVATLTQAGKAAWQTQIALRRLKEAESLALDGQLDEGRKSELEKNFDKSLSRAQRFVKVIEQQDAHGALGVIAQVESRLRAHRDSVTPPAAPGEEQIFGNGKKLEVINVAQAIDRVGAQRAASEAQVLSQSQPEVVQAARGAQRAAQNLMVTVTALFSRQKHLLNEVEHASVEAKLTEAEAMLKNCNDLLDTSDPIDASKAFTICQAAQRLTHETQYLIEEYRMPDVSVGEPSRSISAASQAQAIGVVKQEKLEAEVPVPQSGQLKVKEHKN